MRLKADEFIRRFLLHVLPPLVLWGVELPCDSGAAARHAVSDGRWRGSDRPPLGQFGPSPS